MSKQNSSNKVKRAKPSSADQRRINEARTARNKAAREARQQAVLERNRFKRAEQYEAFLLGESAEVVEATPTQPSWMSAPSANDRIHIVSFSSWTSMPATKLGFDTDRVDFNLRVGRWYTMLKRAPKRNKTKASVDFLVLRVSDNGHVSGVVDQGVDFTSTVRRATQMAKQLGLGDVLLGL